MLNKAERDYYFKLISVFKKQKCHYADEVVILTDMQNLKLSQICTPSHEFGRYHMTINMDIPTILCPFNSYFLILFSLAYGS